MDLNPLQLLIALATIAYATVAFILFRDLRAVGKKLPPKDKGYANVARVLVAIFWPIAAICMLLEKRS